MSQMSLSAATHYELVAVQDLRVLDAEEAALRLMLRDAATQEAANQQRGVSA